MHKPRMAGDDIFDRVARAHARDRAARARAEDRWLIARMSAELAERIDLASQSPMRRALLIGQSFGPVEEALAACGVAHIVAEPGDFAATAARGVQCEEDMLPFADGKFDLVVATGTLDTVNDLPGALVLIRRVLRPGGRFLGAMMGAGSLPALRQLLMDGQAPAVSRIHPQIDVRAAGDLLARAGFERPVADCETVQVRYRSGTGLIRDLRANGMTNQLKTRATLPRQSAAAVLAQRDFAESFAIVYVTGFAPQAQPGNR